MTLTTVTFDPELWQVVPKELNEMMQIRGDEATSGFVEWERDGPCDGSDCAEMVDGIYKAILTAAPTLPSVQEVPQQPLLTVWYGAMPESNGKSNFTAILRRKDGDGLEGMTNSHTIARSEYPERVRYEADRVRYLIGELTERPHILDYDGEKHSGYVSPSVQALPDIVPYETVCSPFALQYMTGEARKAMQTELTQYRAQLALLKGKK